MVRVVDFDLLGWAGLVKGPDRKGPIEATIAAKSQLIFGREGRAWHSDTHEYAEHGGYRQSPPGPSAFDASNYYSMDWSEDESRRA